MPLKSVLLAAHLRVRSALEGASEVVTGFVVNGRAGGDRRRAGARACSSTASPSRCGSAAAPGCIWPREVVRQRPGALQHRRYPMARMQQQLGGRSPFDALFNFIHFHVSEGLTNIPGMRLVEPYWETAWLDLPLDTTFAVDPESRAVKLSLRSHRERVRHRRRPTIARHLPAHPRGDGAPPPGALRAVPVLDEAERNRLLVEWNETDTEPRQPRAWWRCSRSRYAGRPMRWPSSPAPSAELPRAERAGQPARRRLRRQGVEPRPGSRSR